MTTITPAQLAFSAGEVSPLLYRRADYQRTQTGLAKCNGFLPLRQGGFTRAPGTIFDGYTRNNAAGRLVDFEFADNDAMTLEFTPGWLRFWRYGSLVLSGGSPYQIATPYGADSLQALQWEQSADVIYIVDGLQVMQKLSRFSLNNWTIEPVTHDTGPFRVQNLDKDITIRASATTGTIALSASAALFEANHAGSLILLSPTDYSNISLWEQNINVAVGTHMRNDGKVYELLGPAASTGLSPPVHDEGIMNYAVTPGDRRWRFVDDGRGVVRITAVASGTSATAEVLKTVPQACVDDPTYRWSEGAWSDRHGWPSCLASHDQRLIAAATPTDPRTFWASVVGDYEDFTPGVEADDSFAYAIAGQSSLNRILWLASGGTGLHIGALGEEFSTRSSSADVVIGPTTTVIGTDGTIGSRPIRPIVPDGAPIFIAKDGGRVFQITYSFEADRKRATELSLPADHLGSGGFNEIAWQGAPQRLAWLRRGNGELATMLYDGEEDVLGWARCSLAGGAVESMSVSPSSDGTRDVLTLIVARQIGGETVRMVERQSVTWGLLTDAAPAEANHAFAAAVFTPAIATATFSVPHLADESVYAWTEIGSFGPLTVAPDGAVTLPAAVTRATIGIFDDTHVAETLDIQGAAPDGDTMGRRKRLHGRVAVGLHRTAQGWISAIERDFAQAERVGPASLLVPVAVAADLTSVHSGLAVVAAPSGTAIEAALRIRPYGLAPLTVTALIPPVQENGR